MKVKVPVVFTVNMESIYSRIKPLVSKKEFLKKARSEVNQYVNACLDTSSATNLFGLEDSIIESLVDEGYAEFKKE